MNAFYRSRFLPISGLLLGVLVWLANNANPPNGKTAAPFDGTCAECHSGNNPGGFDGIVDISGLPSTIQSNTTYPMTLTMTPTAGTPIKGGFQLVVVDGADEEIDRAQPGGLDGGRLPWVGRHERVGLPADRGLDDGDLVGGQAGLIGDPEAAVLEGVDGVLVRHRLVVDAGIEPDRRVVAADWRGLRVGHGTGDVIARPVGVADEPCDGGGRGRRCRRGCRTGGRV